MSKSRIQDDSKGTKEAKVVVDWVKQQFANGTNETEVTIYTQVARMVNTSTRSTTIFVSLVSDQVIQNVYLGTSCDQNTLRVLHDNLNY